jgi:GT2 family glycosyltransferase
LERATSEIEPAPTISSAASFAIAVPVGAWTPRLAATLSSLARQKPRPIVALMDASDDPRVRALADRFDGLLAVRRHGPDDGQAGAIADGWNALKPFGGADQILGWLNADDYLAPDALARAASALLDPAVDVVTGQSLILAPDAAPRGWHPAAEAVDARIRRSCIVSQPSCFVRRRAVDAVGGLDRSLHYTMDWDLWVRLYDSGLRFAHIDSALSAVIWSPEAKTASLGRRRLSEIARLVRRNESAQTTARTLAGFTLHHTLTYAAPWLRRGWRSRRVGAHGIAEDGRLAARADLELFHEDEPKAGVLVELEGGEARARLSGESGEASAGGKRELRLMLPLPPGARFMLTLETEEEPTRIARLSWIS